MTNPVRSAPAGFHEGELAVQRQAGVARAAARLTGMLVPARLRGGVSRFLAERGFAARIRARGTRPKPGEAASPSPRAGGLRLCPRRSVGQPPYYRGLTEYGPRAGDSPASP
ncbi:hypothetical protein CTZ27_11640 [Streptomyces griseocarneus]|nr:hypothetical protein CTZ27_11640 [Streptomyces griseocarneus]